MKGVALYRTKGGNYFFGQCDRRTPLYYNINMCVEDYLEYGCDITWRFNPVHCESLIITLENNEIKDLYSTHPELFL